MSTRVLALVLPALFAGSAIAQPPAQVKDVNTTQTGGTYQWSTDFVDMGGAAWFTVTDGIHGTELWKSDGAEAGTHLVRDICPGACSSAPRGFVAVGSTLYFSADDGAHGYELWKSDGTEAGTVLVKDLVPGLMGANPFGLFELGGTFYFSALLDATGRELWKSDGTAAGTVLVEDLWPGPGSSSPAPMARLGSVILFAAEDALGRELWSTDGTEAGTSLVKDIHAGSGWSLFNEFPIYPGSQTFAVSGGRLFFAANDGASGNELWVTDGTAAGTSLVEDIFPGTESSFPYSLVDLGGQVLFRADDGPDGAELWISGGTAANTFLVKDIQPGGASVPWELTVAGPWVYFRANDGVHGSELWRSDGTEANTALVKDINPNPNNFFSFYGLAAVGSTVVFFADDGTTGVEPWRSDGTEAGTVPLADLNPGSGSSNSPFFSDRRKTIGGLWYFRGFDDEQDVEVYVSDGTPAGTRQLAEINTQTSAFQVEFTGMLFGANPMADLNGTLFFQASDGISGSELWKSDGTVAGTEQVADASPGPGGSVPFEITPRGNSVLFSAQGSFTQGRELWISDGTEAGTNLLMDLEPTGSTSGGWPWWLTPAGGLVYFTSDIGNGKLWKSDGTPEGTLPVRDAAPTAFAVTELTPMGGFLFYNGAGPAGYELWRTDGTENGTVQVANIAPGSASSNPDRLTPVRNLVFFSADDGSSGRELWASDGATTFRVKDIVPGAGSGIANTLDDQAFRFDHWAATATVRGKLFFPADDGAAGEELWVSDGTEEGTFRLRDICPGPRSSEIHWLTSVGKRVYFVADDGTHGRELWVSNGTALGTRMLADLFPGEGSSLPEQLNAVGQNLVFSAHTPDHGREPWLTDGIEVGTRRLADLAPGPIPSSPVNFTLSGPWLYFAATDADTGFELYSVPQESVDGGMSFYTLTPCRLVDTRVSGGPLSGGGPVTFGAAGLCGIPETAKAIAVNVTAVAPSISGFLDLYRATTMPPGTRLLSFTPGRVRSNNATVHLGGGAFTALALPEFSMSVHLIVDVSGYYE
ncbi:MAG TPA: ELWxxDGT repeat protein [Thermoanaerobaculia bacterium]|nr:ELWxxDGT repeat protein [Thermoanaerobaculia bacterium]